MGYTQKAIQGFGTQTVIKIVMLGLGVLKMMILARILTPYEFGLFSLVMIALGITEATTETGVNVTIINSKHSIKYFLNTAWVIAIIRGFLIGSAMLIGSFAMAAFFETQALLFLVSLAAIIPVIKGFINPSIISMRKELQFMNESTYHLGRLFFEAFLAVILTLLLRDVSALIWALIGAALFEVVCSFIFFPLRPQFQYLHSRGKLILEEAKGLSLNAFLSYLNENLDDVLIGKLITPHGLGLYHNSYAITHKVTHEFGKSTAHGLFPIFSKLRQQPLRLQRAFMKSLQSTLVISSLAAIPLFIWPQALVWILGTQWSEAVPIIRILLFGGFLHTISSVLYSYFLAQQAIAHINWHLGISVLTMVVCVGVLTPLYGLEGAAWGIVLSRMLAFPLLGWGVYHLWQR